MGKLTNTTFHKFTDSDYLLLWELLQIKTPATEGANCFFISSRCQKIFYALLLSKLTVLRVTVQFNLLLQYSILKYVEKRV